MIDGKTHWFGVPGLANGLAVMRDEETESLWDHITGECFEGPLEGQQMTFWGVSMTTAEAELARGSDIILLKSTYRSLMSTFMKNVVHRNMNIGENGTRLPPNFRGTMSTEVDPRLPYGAQGLGLIDNENRHGKFYPIDHVARGEFVEDSWLGRPLRVERGKLDGVPFAIWTDTGERPMQLLTRWYGFSFTYAECEIYSGL